jgi:hypothetical protein
MFIVGISPRLRNSMDSATKATILSLAISEAMNCTAVFLLAGVPLLVGAWLVDRRLRRGDGPARFGSPAP